MQCIIKIVNLFSYNQNFVLWELSALVPWLCTCKYLCIFFFFFFFFFFFSKTAWAIFITFCRKVLSVCLNGSALLINITKTRLYNFYPLQPHFYIVKLGFTGIYIIFHISAQKHRFWVLARTASPRRFLRVPTIYVLSRNMKISEILSENFQFLEVKFSIYLYRRVFVMAGRHANVWQKHLKI